MRFHPIPAAVGTSTLAIATLLAFNTAPAHAQVYDNGVPNLQNAYEMTQLIQAQDFTLDAPATIEAVRFWAIALNSHAYQGSIYYSFLSNRGGQPGAVLRDGLVNPTVTDLETHPAGSPRYQLDFNIAPLNLGSGIFWLALHNGPLTTTQFRGFYWETADGNGTLRGMYDIAPFDSEWVGYSPELAFQLYGANQQVVPEPVSLALLGTGLVGLGAARRRRRGEPTDEA